MLSKNEHLNTLIRNKRMKSSTQPKQSYNVLNRRELTQMRGPKNQSNRLYLLQKTEWKLVYLN